MARPVGAAALVLFVAVLVAGGASVRAQARGPRAAERVDIALEQLSVGHCAREEWAARSVRAVVVVMADGAWAVAVPSARPAMPPADRAALGACLEDALRPALGVSVPLPPRSTITVERTLQIPGDAELATAVAARIDASRPAFERCVRQRAAARLARIDVEARVRHDGRAVAVSATDDGATPIAACIETVLEGGGALPIGAAIVRATVTRRPPPAGSLRAHDGTEGAICAWGLRAEFPEDVLVPEPRACRAGLQCCRAGGIPGVESRCMRRGRGGCPRLP